MLWLRSNLRCWGEHSDIISHFQPPQVYFSLPVWQNSQQTASNHRVVSEATWERDIAAKIVFALNQEWKFSAPEVSNTIVLADVLHLLCGGELTCVSICAAALLINPITPG